MPARTAWHLAFSLLIAVPKVFGHGFIKEVTVDGTNYPGFDPNLDPYADPMPSRVIRRIPNDGPVTNILIADLTCNRFGENGSTALATISDGGSIKEVYRQWNQWLSDHLGPVWTYMASCNGDCADLNLDLDQGGKGLKWFKIDAKGYDPSKKRWASQDVIDAGDSWTSTLPKGLKSGQYLVRHEIVALHSAPAQFYPACLQVSLTGSGTQEAADSNTVSIPGLFNDFVWPDIWGESFSFTIPGPPVISFDGGTNTAAGWSTPPAQATASVGVVSGGGGGGVAPTGDYDDGDYGTTTTSTTATAKKGSSTSPASAPVLNSKPKCVAKSNPALARRSYSMSERMSAALTRHRLRLSFNGLFSS